MKINLTKKQYERMIELMYLGDFIINGYKEEEDEDYSELLQYIYSFAKEMGKENFIEYDGKFQKYFETREFDDEIMPLLDEYEEISFMDNFVNKITSVAFMKKYDNTADEMSSDEFMGKMDAIREKVEQYLDDEGFEKAVSEILKKV